MKNRRIRRLTWGGLMRILSSGRDGTNFYHDHVRMVYPDGHRDFLNVKFDASGRPYFIVVRENRRY